MALQVPKGSLRISSRFNSVLTVVWIGILGALPGASDVAYANPTGDIPQALNPRCEALGKAHQRPVAEIQGACAGIFSEECLKRAKAQFFSFNQATELCRRELNATCFDEQLRSFVPLKEAVLGCEGRVLSVCYQAARRQFLSPVDAHKTCRDGILESCFLNAQRMIVPLREAAELCRIRSSDPECFDSARKAGIALREAALLCREQNNGVCFRELKASRARDLTQVAQACRGPYSEVCYSLARVHARLTPEQAQATCGAHEQIRSDCLQERVRRGGESFAESVRKCVVP